MGMDTTVGDLYDGPSKRRKLSQPTKSTLLSELLAQESEPLNDNKRANTNTVLAKQAGQTVATFLSTHIPEQYASIKTTTSGDHGNQTSLPMPSTKYCYRHQPDLKCRRQVNQPTMDDLQDNLEQLQQGDKQAIAHVWSIFSASTPRERKLILQGILSQCCVSQLSYLSHSVQELIRMDFMSILPAEICFRILCFLDTASLCKAAQVSRGWRLLADDDVVWHRMCEQHIDRKCLRCGWGLPLLERKRLRASKRQIQLRAARRGINEWSPEITPAPESIVNSSLNPDAASTSPTEDVASPLPSEGQSKPRTRPWKDVYKDRFKVGTNWKHGRCDIKVLRGHQNGVTCLQFDDSMIASGSYDTTIKIWDIKSGEELRTLRGHTSAVRCLQFDETKLISGGLDGKIRIWNWRTGECLSTLVGSQTGGVIGLHFDSSILVTGSTDGNLSIWNFDDRSASVLHGHTDWINSVKIDSASRTIFSASDDGTVRIWDLDTKQCIKTLDGHVGQVQQLVLLPRDVEFDLHDGIKNAKSHRLHHNKQEQDHTTDEHTSTSSRAASPTTSTHSVSTTSPPTASIQTFPTPTTITSGTTDLLRTPPKSQHPFGAAFASTNRPLPPRYIVTGSLDSTIRLWDTTDSTESIQTYFGHIEGVWSVAADSLRVVSGAQDKTVKVWDMREGKCDKTFTGHVGAVNCVALSDERMCSGGEDGEVRMYSF